MAKIVYVVAGLAWVAFAWPVLRLQASSAQLLGRLTLAFFLWPVLTPVALAATIDQDLAAGWRATVGRYAIWLYAVAMIAMAIGAATGR